MKQMAAEMQHELETTRTELRRGLFELPQETAESTAQMRRVIVDQIEALAELNRIVARHGRALDTAEPTRRESEPSSPPPARVQQRPAGRPPAGTSGCAIPAPRAPTRARAAVRPGGRAAARDITGAGAPARAAARNNLMPARTQRQWPQRRLAHDLPPRASRDDSPPNAPPGAARAARQPSARSRRSRWTSPA